MYLIHPTYLHTMPTKVRTTKAKTMKTNMPSSDDSSTLSSTNSTSNVSDMQIKTDPPTFSVLTTSNSQSNHSSPNSPCTDNMNVKPTTLSDDTSAGDIDDLATTLKQMNQNEVINPLAQSLLQITYHDDSPTSHNFISRFPKENQPRHVASMGDNTDYFVSENGEPGSLVFPAEIDFEGRFSRCGPYLNLPSMVSNYPF
jgi:hypothetical protein